MVTSAFCPLPSDFSSGSNSVGRVTAFQAVGRGFDPRLPLHSCARADDRACFGECEVGRLQAGVRDADVAQLAERVLGKDEVTGSIPVISSIWRRAERGREKEAPAPTGD